MLTAFLYLPALANDYAWDDLTLIFQPNGYSSDRWLFHAISQPLPFSDNYFRPLVSLVLAADFRYGGTNPQISHAISLGLFLGNGLILLFIIQALCRKLTLTNKQSALYGGGALAFYLLHTSQMESAVWIASRFDLMVTTFLLLALLADTSIEKQGKRAVAVGTCFLLAALCKEMAVFFLPCLVVWHYLLATAERYQPPARYLHEVAIPKHLSAYLAIVLAGSIYLALRYAALGYLLVPETEVVNRYGSFWQHLAAFGKSWFLYLKMLVLPFLDVSIQHPQLFPVPLTDAYAISGLLILALLLAALLTSDSRNALLLALPLLLFFIGIFPVLHLLPLKINIIHDRFMAFPLAMFSIAILPALPQLAGRLSTGFTKLALLLFLGWITVAAASIHSIVPLWKNDLTLWRWTYLKHKDDLYAEIYALSLLNFGFHEEAYQLISPLPRKSGLSHMILGTTLLKQQQLDAALVHFNSALAAGLDIDNKALVIARSGLIELQLGHPEKAEQLLAASLKLVPDNLHTHHYLACLHYQKADFAKTRSALNQAILHTPVISNSRKRYQEYLQELDKAEAVFRATGRLPPLQDVLLQEKVPNP